MKRNFTIIDTYDKQRQLKGESVDGLIDGLTYMELLVSDDFESEMTAYCPLGSEPKSDNLTVLVTSFASVRTAAGLSQDETAHLLGIPLET